MDSPESDSPLHAHDQRSDAQEPGSVSQEPGSVSQEPGSVSQEPGSVSQEAGSVSPTHTRPIAPKPLLSTLINKPQTVTDVINAEASPTGSRERWWTSIAVIGVSLLFFITASIMMAVVATIYVHGSFSTSLLSDAGNLRKVTQSPVGLFLLIVTPQFALVTPCLIAAYLSPHPMRQRLALVKGNWPLWAWVTAAFATPLLGMISGIVIGLFLEESAALREMSDIFRQQGQTGFTAQLILMVALTPALCEELLFRGYVQSRLTRVFPPILGILFSSIAFAAFHMDPVHVIAVIPLGLFLGWLTWQSGSLFPAMLAHFGNNLVSVLAIIVAPTPDSNTFSLPALEFTLGIILLGCIGIVATSFASVIYRRPRPTPVGTSPQPF